MSMPLFFPMPMPVAQLDNLDKALTLAEICQLAGVPCRASGPWTKRRVVMTSGETALILAEAAPRTGVMVQVPRHFLGGHLKQNSRIKQARYVLAALAYGAMDLVARESVRGALWARPGTPRGRPRTGKALSNCERQRRFRDGRITM